MARAVIGTDHRASQTKQRPPDENGASNRLSIGNSRHRAKCRPNGKANPTSDKGMTWVAIRHPRRWVAAPVVSALRWHRHSRAAPPRLSFVLAILRGGGIISLLQIFAACRSNLARPRRIVGHRAASGLRY
jgi:hypothetical protein